MRRGSMCCLLTIENTAISNGKHGIEFQEMLCVKPPSFAVKHESLQFFVLAFLSHVHPFLQVKPSPLLDRARSALSVAHARPSRGARSPFVWRQQRRWRGTADRRNRRGQNDGVPLLPGAGADA